MSSFGENCDAADKKIFVIGVRDRAESVEPGWAAAWGLGQHVPTRDNPLVSYWIYGVSKAGTDESRIRPKVMSNSADLVDIANHSRAEK